MNIEWNAENYTKDFSFVHQYGEDVMSLISKPHDSKVLDLGCGNGALTQKLYEEGYNVLGLDSSQDMLEVAKEYHPNLEFIQDNALSFQLKHKVDVIFSNAVFHWIDQKDQNTLIQNLYSNLNENGELVFEFGGKGCAEMIHSSLEKAFSKRGLNYPRVFYFPSISEYSTLLEKNGFKVEYAILFDRPTLQKNGIKEWIEMFVLKPFEGIEASLKDEIIKEAEEMCKPVLYKDDKWYVDYVRIRMRAQKI